MGADENTAHRISTPEAGPTNTGTSRNKHISPQWGKPGHVVQTHETGRNMLLHSEKINDESMSTQFTFDRLARRYFYTYPRHRGSTNVDISLLRASFPDVTRHATTRSKMPPFKKAHRTVDQHPAKEPLELLVTTQKSGHPPTQCSKVFSPTSEEVAIAYRP